jgi:hypothetical protein
MRHWVFSRENHSADEGMLDAETKVSDVIEEEINQLNRAEDFIEPNLVRFNHLMLLHQ